LRFEIYSTDESGILNKSLKFLPLHHRSPGLVSIFGRESDERRIKSP